MTDDKKTVATAATAMDEDAAESGDRAFLVVYLGQGDDQRTRVVELPDGVEVTVGRTRGATIWVDDEKVSRLHSRIQRRKAEIVVEDLGSRNGTRVNGTRIEAPSRVVSGDEIGIGAAVFVVGVTTRLRRRTPVGSLSDLEERLAAEVDRAARYRRPLGLVMLRLDGQAAAADAAIDHVARVVRRMDYLAEYGPDEFGIVLPEADRTAAHITARRVVEEARKAALAHGGVAAHAGVASFSDDGVQPLELLSAARAALRVARVGGGDDGVAGAPVETGPRDEGVIIKDPQMQRVHALIRRVADTPITVLILGETGVGKEVVAEALHRQSSRAAKPFVKLNCASLAETILESELFGHERGAFTGADRRKIGYFEAAEGGTLLLDEIGEVPLSVQVKLLRVLEDRKVLRLGGTAEIPVDVRVVCATNRDLDVAVKRGQFREDLFFRVSAFSVLVPPLRDRPLEVGPLAEDFAQRFAKELKQPTPRFAADAMRALQTYAWPGNVRELRNAVERAIVLQPSGTVEVEHLPERIRDAASGGGILPPIAGNLPLGDTLDVREHVEGVEKAAIVAALAACAGNQTRAAVKLGLSRRALIYKLEKYGLKPPPGSPR
jgi:DNA-binding NtrC family response regulator/pSer/pThr/pTyr-binding forkhead associated (FHA) protein